MPNKLIKTIIGIVSVILISIASFYIYFATRETINSGFTKWGIENVWAQVAIVVVAVIILIVGLTMLLGKKVNVFETIKDIFET